MDNNVTSRCKGQLAFQKQLPWNVPGPIRSLTRYHWVSLIPGLCSDLSNRIGLDDLVLLGSH